MRHPTFHVSAKLVGSVSSVTGFLRQCAVDKKPGDAVFAGTINGYGCLEVRATHPARDTALQHIILLVSEADRRKAPLQRTVDRWAVWLVPIALFLAILAYFLTGNLERAATVLVVFCPCALALATPTSVIAAIGQATRYGVLIKSGEALERMARVTCYAMDKTGTLTFGKLIVSDIIPLAAGTITYLRSGRRETFGASYSKGHRSAYSAIKTEYPECRRFSHDTRCRSHGQCR